MAKIQGVKKYLAGIIEGYGVRNIDGCIFYHYVFSWASIILKCFWLLAEQNYTLYVQKNNKFVQRYCRIFRPAVWQNTGE